jgi:hypothetical protein
MNARMINRIETSVEQVAAALLGGSAGYAAYSLSNGGLERALYAAGASALAYILCLMGMKAASEGKASFDIRIFDVSNLGILEPEELLLTEQLSDELVLTQSDRLDAELVLTDADRLQGAGASMPEPLVLDDVLAAVGADARVVRLFDRKAMPTPGQMSSSIERHLDRGAGSGHPDAAQALSDALAELRRSLR